MFKLLCCPSHFATHFHPCSSRSCCSLLRYYPWSCDTCSALYRGSCCCSFHHQLLISAHYGRTELYHTVPPNYHRWKELSSVDYSGHDWTVFFFYPVIYVTAKEKYIQCESRGKTNITLFSQKKTIITPFLRRAVSVTETFLSKRQEDGQREREIHWQLLICLSSSQNISADTLRLIQHDTSCLDSMPGLPVSVISDSKSHRHTEICLDGEGLQSAQHNIGFLLGSYSRNWIYWRNHISSVYYLKITL